MLLNRIIKTNLDEPGEPKEHPEHNGRRAIRNWRVLLQGVCDLVALVSKLGSGAAAEQLGGYSHGSSSSMRQAYKPFHSELQSKSAEQKGEIEASDKQVHYAQVIKNAPMLNRRKCKEPPQLKVTDCFHPAAMLKGGGNQYSREIWCGMCHQRWHTTEKQMEPVQKKTREKQVKKDAITDSTPKETPTVLCQCRMPAQRHLVKKDGPTKGRHLWRCRAMVCEFFQWDELEQQALKAAVIQNLEEVANTEKEEKIAQRVRQEVIQEAEARYEEALRATIAKHELEMAEKTGNHQLQLQHMQSQVTFMTAAMGEERTREILEDPEVHQQVMAKAQELQRQMAFAEVRKKELEKDHPME